MFILRWYVQIYIYCFMNIGRRELWYRLVKIGLVYVFLFIYSEKTC